LGRLHQEDLQRVVRELLDIGVTEGTQRRCAEQQNRPGLDRPARLDQHMVSLLWFQFREIETSRFESLRYGEIDAVEALRVLKRQYVAIVIESVGLFVADGDNLR